MEGQLQLLEPTKRCSKCGDVLPQSGFYVSKGRLTGRCRECLKADMREYSNRPEEIERRRAYYWANREQIMARNTPEVRANNYYKRTYGITLQQRNEMLAALDGRCPLCQREQKSLHIDHDHATGRVRGVICGPCNRGIGLLADDPETLRRAADYLEAAGG